MPAHTDEILRALADPERLAIAGFLARRPATAEELAGELDLKPDRVRKHLVRLMAVALGAVDEDEETVLRQYFREGRLREIPAKHAKRLIVLHRIALEFDVGRRYSEREVNEIVARFHNDHASLRRHLVDEGLLSRER